MKKLFTLTLLLFASSHLQASIEAASNQFPFLLAELKMEEAVVPPTSMRLTQWVSPRRDGVFVPSYFELGSETCVGGNCNETFAQFGIVSREMDTCHRVYFVAVEQIRNFPRVLKLTDHQGNFCPGEKKALWEIEIVDNETRTSYSANPERVRH